MDTELVNKVSSLTVHVFYDTSKDMITVHFINEQSGKADIMAYHLMNGSWDVREVIDETAKVFSDKEVIEIRQKPIGIFEKDSGFDKLVRRAIEEMAKVDDSNVQTVDMINEILGAMTQIEDK